MLVHTRILVTFVFLTYSMGFNVQTSGSSAPGFGVQGFRASGFWVGTVRSYPEGWRFHAGSRTVEPYVSGGRLKVTQASRAE